MTKTKICGLMRLEDIAYVNDCTPEYAGFVFAESHRQVDGEWVKGLRLFLDPEIQVVGVFVNEKIDTIASLCENHTIDVIQLHGDEGEEYINHLRRKVDNPIIKAVRVRSSEDILRAEQLSCEFLLLDTYTKGQYGGSGQSFDTRMIPKLNKPFFLAGGLDAFNVKEKILSCKPYAVDISSGVEGEDGWKDYDKIREFIGKVREER